METAFSLQVDQYNSPNVWQFDLSAKPKQTSLQDTPGKIVHISCDGHPYDVVSFCLFTEWPPASASSNTQLCFDRWVAA